MFVRKRVACNSEIPMLIQYSVYSPYQWMILVQKCYCKHLELVVMKWALASGCRLFCWESVGDKVEQLYLIRVVLGLSALMRQTGSPLSRCNHVFACSCSLAFLVCFVALIVIYTLSGIAFHCVHLRNIYQDRITLWYYNSFKTSCVHSLLHSLLIHST